MWWKNEKSNKKKLNQRLYDLFKQKDLNSCNQKLYDLFKQKDLNSCNKPIYILRLDGEEESKKRRVFSKIFKLDKNNQYGFTMTKPLLISIFKKEHHVDMDTLNRSIENFGPNARFGDIFVVDIQFDAYNDPCKKMYNEVFPCVFEPKSKVSVNRYSVYQLLSTMRTGKRNNVLKYKGTEKMHFTLCPKKRFPMFIATSIFWQREKVGKLLRYTVTTRLSKNFLRGVHMRL